MKTTDLKELVVAAISQDSTLDSYCLGQYGGSLSVFGSFSGELPPPPSDCPCAIIHSPAKKAHQNSRRRQYGIGADFYVYDTDDETRTDDAEVSSGADRLLEIMRLSRNAVFGALPSNIAGGYEEETDTVTLWPLLPGAVVFEFEEEITLGSGDPALD